VALFKSLNKITYSILFFFKNKFRVLDFSKEFELSHFFGCTVWDLNFFRTILDITKFSGCPVSWDTLYKQHYGNKICIKTIDLENT